MSLYVYVWRSYHCSGSCETSHHLDYHQRPIQYQTLSQMIEQRDDIPAPFLSQILDHFFLPRTSQLVFIRFLNNILCEHI
jgi:hypothetical protein